MSKKDITERIKNLSKAVKPTIPPAEVNETYILVENLPFTLKASDSNSSTVEMCGDVFIKWLPEPRIYIDSQVKEVGLEILDTKSDPYLVNSDLFKHEIKTILSNCSISSAGEAKLRMLPISKAIELKQPETEFLDLRFSVPNFPLYHGKPITTTNNARFNTWLGRIEFETEGWVITLDKVSNHKYLKDKLTDTGGYAITFGGELKKLDNSPFTFDQSLTVLNKLSHLFTFSSGQKTHPLLPVGTSTKNEQVALEWQLPMIDRWKTAMDSWVDLNNPQAISYLAPRFFKLLDDEPWRSNLPQLLYWYTFANRNTRGAGTDGSIIIAVAALEQLAWIYLGKEEYKRNQLKTNLKKLFKSLALPTRIPEHLTSLKEYAIKEMNWQGGSSHVIAELRNEIVHPDRKNRIPNKAIYEGLCMALWYFDISLLTLCAYEGSYVNRTKPYRSVGETDQFPIN